MCDTGKPCECNEEEQEPDHMLLDYKITRH
jgi:hypothetical protein